MVFDEKTLAEYKEAFGVIDKDGDGTIDHKELKACFEELGNLIFFLILYTSQTYTTFWININHRKI